MLCLAAFLFAAKESDAISHLSRAGIKFHTTSFASHRSLASFVTHQLDPDLLIRLDVRPWRARNEFASVTSSTALHAHSRPCPHDIVSFHKSTQRRVRLTTER